MEEFEKLYTVEDIATMTSLTSRTIRNYLKNGSLKGRKIGGQWRFTMKDIKQLFDNSNVAGDISHLRKQQIFDFIDGVNTDMHKNFLVCTIADCFCENRTKAQQLYEKLVAVINNKTDNTSAKFGYDFIEKENKARFTLIGSPDFIIETLCLLKPGE